jgi:hypothetical protein
VHLLGSVSCAPASRCTAVGDYETSTGAGLTLAEARSSRGLGAPWQPGM